MQVVVGILLVALSYHSASAASEWSYEGSNGPDHWADAFATCSGNFQSPINFVLNAADIDDDLGEITFTGYSNPSLSTGMVLSNNGHTVRVGVANKVAEMSGGGLPGTYILQQFHLHWGGVNGDPGSEHTVDGIQHPGELHFVSYKEAYLNDDGSLNVTLVGDSNDLGAALGFFIEIGDTKNDDFQIILDALSEIQDPKTETNLTGLDLSRLMPSNKKNFLRYQGGLTTPECQEVVVWTVMNSTIKITNSQYMALAGGLHHTKLGDNNEADVILQKTYRPVQELKGRKVKATWNCHTKPGTPGAATRGGYSHLMMTVGVMLVAIINLFY